MLEEVKKYPNFYNQIKNNFLNKESFFHAYIIETSNVENYETVIEDLVKFIFYKSSVQDKQNYEYISEMINNDSFIDYKKINPKNNVIKKEQLLFVKESFKNKSINNKQIYVIFEADKMNNYASNTILKFLEEPNDGVMAFFIVKNRYLLLDTIISRCQILTLDNKTYKSNNDNKLVPFFELFTSEKDAFLNYNQILNELFIDKTETLELLDLLEKKYYTYISDSNIIDKSDKTIEQYMTNLTTDDILKLIKVLDIQKEKLNYNVNFKLWLDNFIIDYFMEVKKNV